MMSQTPQLVATWFNDPTAADVVILSSDNVAFKLHKLILSIGSDFFKDMFDLPQPSKTNSGSDIKDSGLESKELDGLPVIDVTEPSAVLDKLFRLCYPLENPTLDSLTEVREVLAAALKYQLRKSIQYAMQRFRDFLPTDPLRVYAIACILSLWEEACAAMLKVREQGLQNTWVDELEEISIGRYHQLIQYCAQQPPAGSASVFLQTTSPQTGTIPPPIAGENPLQTTFEMYPESCFPVDCADVIIETRDGAQFPTISALIRFASPVLASRLHGRSASQLNPLVVDESRDVMAVLLCIYGPSELPPLMDLFAIHRSILAAKRYGMQKAIQTLQMSLELQFDDFAAQDVFSLYIVACHLGLRDFAVTAAKRTLGTNATANLNLKLDRLDISAGPLYRLLAYQRACLFRVYIMRTDRSWLESYWQHRLKCHGTDRGWACWYDRYMGYVFGDGKQWRTGASAVEPKTIAFITSSNICHFCASPAYSYEVFIDFTKFLRDCTVGITANQVDLEFK